MADDFHSHEGEGASMVRASSSRYGDWMDDEMGRSHREES